MPNLFIVGAPKAGTTSLYEYLNKHKDIFFPYKKEPHFLYKDRVKNRIKGAVSNLDEYSALYGNAGFSRYQGDASVYGLLYSEEAIRSIKKLFGSDVKIIALLREPVDRAFAAYLHVRRNNDDKESDDFIEAFKGNSDFCDLNPMMFYRQGSTYFNAINNYKREFECVKVLYSDQFFSDTKNELIKIYDFLGLDYSDELFEGLGKHNEGGKDLSNPIYSYLLKRVFDYDTRAKIKRRFPNLYKFLKEKAFGYFFQDARRLSPAEYSDLSEYFVDDLKNLYNLLGDRQLKVWMERMARVDSNGG